MLLSSCELARDSSRKKSECTTRVCEKHVNWQNSFVHDAIRRPDAYENTASKVAASAGIFCNSITHGLCPNLGSRRTFFFSSSSSQRKEERDQSGKLSTENRRHIFHLIFSPALLWLWRGTEERGMKVCFCVFATLTQDQDEQMWRRLNPDVCVSAQTVAGHSQRHL